MATVTLIDVRLLLGGYELSADHYQGTLTRTRQAVEATTFGSDSRVYRPGLKDASYSLNGYFDADGSAAVNDVYSAQYAATVDQLVSIIAPDGLEGSAAHVLPGIHSEVQDFGGSVGDMAAFTVTGQGTGDSFRGTVLGDGTSAVSSSGNGTAFQISDLVSGETGRGALHVIAATGSPTLDVTVESDDASGMTTPTTRLTFTQATAVGAELQTFTTPTSDDWYRVAWTFGGTGSITFAVVFGIA